MKHKTYGSDTSFVFFPWLFGALFLAGIVHIVSIFAMPWLAPKDAFARMAAAAPVHQMTLLPDPTPQESAPFDDPALVQGVCRYDLSQGRLRLRANLPPDELLLMSFHGRQGQVYYSMTDRSATRGSLDVLILTRPQLDIVEANDKEDELPQDLRIIAPTLEGFILLRALSERPSLRDEARQRISAVTCSLESDSKP
jgi:uncharacterized membrane protein